MTGTREQQRSDLPTRFAAAVVMIAVAIVATYLGGWWFRALAAAAAAQMVIELADMPRVARRRVADRDSARVARRPEVLTWRPDREERAPGPEIAGEQRRPESVSALPAPR